VTVAATEPGLTQGDARTVSPYFSVTHDHTPGSTRELPSRVPRVAVVGAGFVGSTTAYALLLSGTASEIVLIDRNKRRAEGHAHDLRDAEVFSHSTRVVVGDFGDCCTSDVIILTAGLGQGSRKSRLEGLKETAAMIKGLVLDVARYNPRGILLIASNPVDVLTYAAWKWSGLPASRVIGSGTSLDTSRFRRRLAEKYGVSSDNVHAYIIGEHGDSQVPVISSARVAGMPLQGFCRELALPADEENSLDKIATETRAAGLEIITAKGATYFGIGAALARIVSAILRNEHAVLAVSSLVPESLGLGEVSLSLPSIINRDGVARVLSIPLDQAEKQALHQSADVVKQHIATLDLTVGGKG
jgi:L-lactate dehydrogenase